MPDPVAPQLSALDQPGSSVSAAGPIPAPNPSTPPADVMTPAMAAPDVTDRSINPAQPPAPPPGYVPPNAPHARLLQMVTALADGLAGFSAGIASKGKVSGAEVVQNLEGQRAEQQQRAQAAVQAQRDAELRNKLTVAQTNNANIQNHLLTATLPDEVSLKHMQVQEETTKLGGEQFNLFANTGMNPQQIAALTSGGAVDAKTSDMMQTNAQRQYRLASQLLPSNNPSLAALRTAIDSGNPVQLVIANKNVQAEIQGQKDITDDKIKQADAASKAPFGDKAAMVNDAILRRMQVNNPNLKALPAGYAMTPDSTPSDLDRVDKLLLPTEQAEATKVNREIVNGMREQMLDLAKGVKIPGDETKSGTDYLATLPVGLQGTVKEIGEGRAAPPPAGSRSPAAQTINAALNRAFPDYDATKYPSYLDARKKFTSGPEGKGINALNTVETHLSRMYDHAIAPGTSGGITGRVTGFFGDKDVRALDIDRTAVATELSKAYAAGQISEGEIKDWEDKLDFTKPGMTTGKLITNLKEIDSLLEGKQKAYETQWTSAAPSASIVSPVPIISSEASAARAKIRGEAASTTPAAPAASSAHKVGDQVTLKNGQSVVIKTMNPDGTFTY